MNKSLTNNYTELIEVNFLIEFFNSLNKNNIDYCILRNQTEILNGDFHDVDIFTKKNCFPLIKKAIFSLCKKHDWKIHSQIDKDNLIEICLFTIKNGEIYFIHLDIINSFKWKGVELIRSEDIFKNNRLLQGIRITSSCMEAIICMMTRLIYHGYIKEEYKDLIYFECINNSTLFKKQLESITNKKYSEFITKNILNRNWDVIEAKYKVIRRKIILKRLFERKFQTTIDISSYIYKLLKRVITPTGTFIVLMGPDGSGKTTIIQHLKKKMFRTFTEDNIHIFHWRPGFLKQIRNIYKKKDDSSNNEFIKPHSKKNHGQILSFIRFCYYLLDYILGYIIIVRPKLMKGGLVIFDRYYYDYFIDQKRLRMKVNYKIIKLFNSIIPKPNITFILMGDAHIIHARKQELTLDEINNQNKKLLETKQNLLNPIIININHVVDIVSNQIIKELIFNMERDLNK